MRDRARTRWHALRLMSWSERRQAAHAFLALTGVRLALATLGFRRAQALLARLAGPPLDPALLARLAGPPPALDLTLTADVPSQAPGAIVETTARAVDRAARFGPQQPACLPRALTLWWLLRRQGLAAEIRIGTRRVADGLEAHAWVEYKGQVLNDEADVHDRFAAFSGPVYAFTGPIRSRAGYQARGSTRPLGGSGG